MAAKKEETKAVQTAPKESAATKRPAAKKKQAEPMEPALILQYQGADTDLNALVASVKANFKAEKPRTKIQSLNLYIKPEDHAAYYVINGKFEGKVEF